MRSRLLALAAISLFGVTSASGTLIAVDVGTLQVFTQAVEIPPLLEATVDFTPQLSTSGEVMAVDVRIELPSGLDVAAIDVESVRLCRVVAGCADAVAPRDTALVGDADGDGVPDLSLTFSGGAVSWFNADVVAPRVSTLAVSGRLRETGRWFASSATITIAGAVR